MRINSQPATRVAFPSARTSNEETEQPMNIEKAILQLQITMLCMETHMVQVGAWEQLGRLKEDTGAVMFHPPKMPQQQRNGNRTGFQRVPIENPLNADVAPVSDPFFQPLLAVVGHCWFNGRC